jgi:hypothetical protein
MKIYLVAILVNCFSFSYSQVSYKSDSLKINYKPSTWLDIGYGWSTRKLGFYGSLNAELKNHWLLTLSYDRAYSPVINNPFLLGVPIPMHEAGFDINSLSLKIGRITKGKSGLISWSAGISSLASTEYPENGLFTEAKSKKTIGFSIDAKIIASGRFAGIGIIPYANINSIKSYMGFTFCIAIGQLKVLKQ